MIVRKLFVHFLFIFIIIHSALSIDTPTLYWGEFVNESFNQTLTDSIYCKVGGENCTALNPFNQNLNTSGNVSFYSVNATDWSNVTITESQINNYGANSTDDFRRGIEGQGYYNESRINTTQLQKQIDNKLGILWSWFVSSWNDLMALVSWGGDLIGTGTSPQVASNSTMLDIANITNYAGNSSAQIIAVIVPLNYYNDSNQQPDESIKSSWRNITDISDNFYNKSQINDFENVSNYNLTAYMKPLNGTKNIYNWQVDGKPIAVLNMPFEGVNGTATNNAWDYSGLGRTGTETNIVWNATGGYDGKGAYEFNGSNGIKIGVDSLTVYNFSTCLWMKTHAPNVQQNIFGGDGLIGGTVLQGTQYKVFDGVSYRIGSPGFSADVWHHLCTTYNNATNNLTLYSDGVQEYTGTAGTVGYGLLLNIGASGGSALNFNGTIDEVMIFNRSLSAEQILALFNNRTDLIVSQETNLDERWGVEIYQNNGTSDTFSSSKTILIKNNLFYLEGIQHQDDLLPYIRNQNSTQSEHIEAESGNLSAYVRNNNVTVKADIDSQNATQKTYIDTFILNNNQTITLFWTQQNLTMGNFVSNRILLNNQTMNLFQTQQNTTQSEHIEAESGNLSAYVRNNNVTVKADIDSQNATQKTYIDTFFLNNNQTINLFWTQQNSTMTSFVSDRILLSNQTANAYWLSNNATVGDARKADPLSQFAATTSLQLKNTISDETGSGALTFATSPTFTTDVTVSSATNPLIKLTDTTTPKSWHWVILDDADLSLTETGVADNVIRAKAGGNVGIGISPGTKLDVNGNIRARGNIQADDWGNATNNTVRVINESTAYGFRESDILTASSVAPIVFSSGVTTGLEAFQNMKENNTHLEMKIGGMYKIQVNVLVVCSTSTNFNFEIRKNELVQRVSTNYCVAQGGGVAPSAQSIVHYACLVQGDNVTSTIDSTSANTVAWGAYSTIDISKLSGACN